MSRVGSKWNRSARELLFGERIVAYDIVSSI